MSEASTSVTPKAAGSSVSSDTAAIPKESLDSKSVELKSLQVIPQGPETSEINAKDIDSNIIKVEKPVCQVITVKAGPAQAIAVDGVSLKDGGAILSADGKDLIIKYPEGGIIIVEDYFVYAGDTTPANIITDDGVFDGNEIAAATLGDENLGQLSPAAGGTATGGTAPTGLASASEANPVAPASNNNSGTQSDGGGANFSNPEAEGIGPGGTIEIDPLGEGAKFDTGFDVEFEGSGEPVAQVPSIILSPTAVVGNEDTSITLGFSAHLNDNDGGNETLTVIIGNVPAGAILSAGTDNHDGTWTLQETDIPGLTITPPADSDVDLNLTITAIATESNGSTASITEALPVEVIAIADAPNLTTSNASGDEDTAIALTIDASLTDTDGSETLSIIISGVPTGATLSAGTDNHDGTWTLTQAELVGLTITPPANSDADFTLTVTARSTEANDGQPYADTVSTIDVVVDAVADQPTLSVHDASGDEDTAIGLNIASSLTDTDGSETLSITISGVPAGAKLSAGTETFTGSGVYVLTSAELSGLTITPPTNSDADFDLTVTATSTETSNSDTASISDTLHVTVNAVADAPIITASDVTGDEDTAIALSIDVALTDTDGSESLSLITISGVPAGATLSAGTETYAGSGVYTLTQAELVGLTVTPPTNSDADFQLTISVTSTEAANGDTATTTETIDVTVNAVADTPTLSVHDASGDEDTAIGLNIASSLTDTDGSETLSITISGVPTGATLSAGTDNHDGTWTLTSGDLVGLTITPPTNSDVDFTLTVTATSKETSNNDTASISDTLHVTVNAVADQPTLSVHDASGDEDTAISLSIASSLTDTDGSETLSITISGVPTGATLSAGTDNHDGTWTLTNTELTNLKITPPEDSADDFTLTVTATSTEAENGDTATASQSLKVVVNPIADVPTLYVVTTASGTEVNAGNQTIDGTNAADTIYGGDGDDTINGLGGDDHLYGDGSGVVNVTIDIVAAIANDIDFSEEITEIRISGIPSGSTVSIGTIVSGVWIINNPADIATVLGTATNAAGMGTVYSGGVDPVLTLPAGSSGTYNLKAVVIATDHDTETSATDTETSAETTIAVTVIAGTGAGNDTIYGGDGNDYIYGGAGDGSASGNDVLYGDAGNDHLYGEDGNDILYGGIGNDYLYGGTGNDILYGEAGDDYLTGEAGNDYLSGGDGNDRLYGDAGDDALVGGNGTDSLYGGTGNDILYGEDGDDYLSADSGDDILLGGDGNDTLIGSTGKDKLYGGAGDDKLYFSYDYRAASGSVAVNSCSGLAFSYAGLLASYDLYDGGADTDTLYGTNYSSAGDAILYSVGGTQMITGVEIIDARDGNDFVNLDGANEAFTVYGGSGNDTIWGGNLADKLYGDSGNDTIYGGDGGDLIEGGTGNDLVVGCAGADTVKGGDGDDTVKGFTGDDFLYGDAGNDIIWGNAGNDKIDGGTGYDIAAYEGQVGDFCFDYDFSTNEWVVTDRVDDTGVVLLGDEGQDRLVNIENLTFDDYNFNLPDGVPTNIIKGTAGDELLNGGCYDDVIFGLDGDDCLYGHCNNDYIFGGAGNDQIDGGADDDFLFGGYGNDVLVGSSGNDALFGEAGDDFLYGGSEEDYLNGGIGNDWLDGGLSEDVLNGAYGDDILFGGTCDDILIGGAGNDSLFGEGGSDTFVFTEFDIKSGYDVDTIFDFETIGADQDTIDLDDLFDSLGIADADRSSCIDITNTTNNQFLITVYDNATDHSSSHDVFNIYVHADVDNNVSSIQNHIDFGTL